MWAKSLNDFPFGKTYSQGRTVSFRDDSMTLSMANRELQIGDKKVESPGEQQLTLFKVSHEKTILLSIILVG